MKRTSRATKTNFQSRSIIKTTTVAATRKNGVSIKITRPANMMAEAEEEFAAADHQTRPTIRRKALRMIPARRIPAIHRSIILLWESDAIRAAEELKSDNKENDDEDPVQKPGLDLAAEPYTQKRPRENPQNGG